MLLGGKSLNDADLSWADRAEILRYSAHWARLVFRQDRKAFRQYIALGRRLERGPSGFGQDRGASAFFLRLNAISVASRQGRCAATFAFSGVNCHSVE